MQAIQKNIAPVNTVQPPVQSAQAKEAAAENEVADKPVQFILQRKLSVGSPDDPLEQEADNMADRVMRMPEPFIREKTVINTATVVQRKCAACEAAGASHADDDELVQRMPEDEDMEIKEDKETSNDILVMRKCAGCGAADSSHHGDNELVQRASEDDEAEEEEEGDESVQRKCAACESGTSGLYPQKTEDRDHVHRKPLTSSITPFIQTKQNGEGVTSDGLTNRISSSRGNGSNMDGTTKSFMENRFGADFSNVKIHTGSDATSMNRELNAKAFTVGNDIYFNDGQYNPGADSGKFLLAHELTHTLQQNGGVQAKLFTPHFIQREEAMLEPPVFEPTREQFDEMDEGNQVELTGIVQTEDGANLWAQPDRKQAKLGLLKQNTRVFVDRKLPGNWYSVYVEGHQRGEAPGVTEGTFGYIDGSRINTDMPDPGAWLYRITKGEGALAVAQKVYKGYTAEWGKDFRYLVNVMVAVNKEKGREFLYKEKEDDSWEDAKTKSDGQIWVPGMELVNAMHGLVSSGSISYEVLSTIGEIFVGIGAFIVGLIEGLLMSIADIFIGVYDLAKMAVDIFKKLIDGTLISDAKEFFNDISKIKMSDIIDMLDAKWNHPDTWERWKFRGYVIGYAIMEVVILVFSVGALTAVKWAGKVTKIGKFAEYLSKLPKVAKFIEAAKALKTAQAEKLRLALKAAFELSELHGWAAKVMRIPMNILLRISEADIGKLKKLPQYLREKFARLSEKAMLRILGCNSPCKVDLRAIEESLKLAGKAGTKLTDVESVLKVLKSLPGGINVRKISQKLRRSPSALLTAIKEAGLTDKDFAKMADFLTAADLANPAAGYQTFVRYLTSVVPAKTGKDIKELNRIAEALVVAEKGRGAAMKGPIFEQWIALHIPELSSKAFERTTFDLKKLFSKKVPPFTRNVDKWVPDAGEIWEMKHQFSKVPADQIADYAALVGKAAPDGKIVKSINYLFPDKAAAEINRHVYETHKMAVWYVDEATSTLMKLK